MTISVNFNRSADRSVPVSENRDSDNFEGFSEWCESVQESIEAAGDKIEQRVRVARKTRQTIRR